MVARGLLRVPGERVELRAEHARGLRRGARLLKLIIYSVI